MDSPKRSKLFFENATLLWCGLALFCIAGIINQRFPMPKLQLSKQETAVNINKELLLFMSAGNSRLITDLLWVQTLLESDLEHYSSRDLSNWMFIRFNTIASLDPQFYENYLWGGQYLAIVKDDLLGAVEILEKGAKVFPDDYRILSNLGFTYYFELGNYEKGLEYIEKIQHHPKAPAYFPTIVMKMKTELGFDINVILARIKELIRVSQDERIKEKLEGDYYALKAERDIRCLNSGKADCETKDARGIPYIRQGDRYYSHFSFIPYRLKRKGDNKQTKPVHTMD